MSSFDVPYCDPNPNPNTNSTSNSNSNPKPTRRLFTVPKSQTLLTNPTTALSRTAQKLGCPMTVTPRIPPNLQGEILPNVFCQL